jgi:hypothetical protein
VTVLHSHDHHFLSQNLRSSDDHLTKAYLFPTREQLELLGAFIDTEVTSEELLEYWKDIFQTLYGSSQGLTHLSTMVNLTITPDTPTSSSSPTGMMSHIYTTVFVLKYFESIQIFAMDLEIFLEERRMRTRRGREVREQRQGPQVPLEILFGVFKECAIQGSPLPPYPPYPTLPYPPSPPSPAEKKSFYRIADLEEKQQQASIIAEYEIPFPQRYIFCLAPVSMDNDRLRSQPLSSLLPSR